MKRLAALAALAALAGCQNFAEQTKVWEQGCHVIIDGTMSAGLTGVSGQASVHKECWPDGQDHAATSSPSP